MSFKILDCTLRDAGYYTDWKFNPKLVKLLVKTLDSNGVDIIELGYKLTNPTGKIILVGVPKKDNNICIYSLPLHFGKLIQGSHGGESIPHEDIPRYLKMLKKLTLVK